MRIETGLKEEELGRVKRGGMRKGKERSYETG
jgi:hypothetical protein